MAQIKSTKNETTPYNMNLGKSGTTNSILNMTPHSKEKFVASYTLPNNSLNENGENQNETLGFAGAGIAQQIFQTQAYFFLVLSLDDVLENYHLVYLQP